MSKFTKLIPALAVACGFGFAALAAYVQPLGGSIFPLTFVTQPVTNLTDAYNEMLGLINAQVVGISTAYPGTALEPAPGFDTSQAVFASGVTQQNPVLLQHYQNVPIGAVNAGGPNGILVQGAPGRTIYPDGAGILVDALGGNVATCTSVSILCSPSTAAIGTWAITNLSSGRPVGLFSASTVGYGATNCVAGDAVVIDQAGSACATATGIAVTIPYTVQ